MKSPALKKIIYALPFACCFLVVSGAWATPVPTDTDKVKQPEVAKKAKAAKQPNSTQDVQKLEKLEVIGRLMEPGHTEISAEEIRMMPLGRATVADALRVESSVQFDRGSRGGHTAGEIDPSHISIRGSSFYDNAFTVNGLTSMNTLSANVPQRGSNPDSANGPKGAPAFGVETLVVPLDLLDVISVQSENVSAEYGNFTGGVVDAQVRKAATDRWHISTQGRYTSDKMARRYYNWEQDPDNPKARDINTNKSQPEFTRYSAGVTVEGPLMDGKLGVLMNYDRTFSRIPRWVIRHGETGVRVKTTRLREMFMLQVNTNNAEGMNAKVTLMHNPYTSALKPWMNIGGDYEMEGGGTGLTLNLTNDTPYGVWTNDLGWLHSNASRVCDSNISWYGSWEGGFGSYKSEGDQLTWSSKIAFNDLKTGPLTHKIKAGGEVLYKNAKVDVSDFTLIGAAMTPEPPSNAPRQRIFVHGDHFDQSVLGVDGDTASTFINYQPAMKQKKYYTTLSLFAEDEITLKRLTVRPGVRVSFDTVTDDINVAPRFLTDIDMLGNDKYHLYGGFNRYYGNQIMAGYLGYHPQTRPYWRKVDAATGEIGPWQEFYTDPGDERRHHLRYDTIQKRDYSSLKTPYSDEFSLGFTARLPWDTYLKISGVRREYRDEIRTNTIKEKKDYASVMTNEGRRTYKGVTLNLDKSFDLGAFGHHFSSLGITWSSLKGNAKYWDVGWDYNNVSDDSWSGRDVNEDKIIYEGKLIDREDLPASNFNSPLVITYTHRANFWNDRLRTMLEYRFEEGYKRLLPTSGGTINGIKYKGIKSYKSTPMLTWDASIDFDVVKFKDATVTLQGEILNIFNTKNTTYPGGSRFIRYGTGRQFFVGLKARF